MFKKLSLLFIVIVLGSAACKHDPFITDVPDVIIPPPPPNPDPCDPDTVYFQNTILPLLTSSCAVPDCHDAISHEEGIVMDSYAHIMNSDIIDVGDGWGSEMIEKIMDSDPDDVMPPPPYDELDGDEVDQIVTWINQGALNNSCQAECDPNAAATFALVVQPIIANACEGCHSGGNASADLSLTNYSQISTIALNGSLMYSLTATNGYVLMPFNSYSLSDCQISQIQAWIDAGAPND